MSIFQTTSPVTIPSERELYSLYAGFNQTEIGHLFTASAKGIKGKEVPEGMIRLGGLSFDKVEGRDGSYIIQEEPVLFVTLNPDVIQAWEDLTKSGISWVSISRRVDGLFNVQLTVTGMSDYTVGILSPADIKALIESADLPLTRILSEMLR